MTIRKAVLLALLIGLMPFVVMAWTARGQCLSCPAAPCDMVDQCPPSCLDCIDGRCW